MLAPQVGNITRSRRASTIAYVAQRASTHSVDDSLHRGLHVVHQVHVDTRERVRHCSLQARRFVSKRRGIRVRRRYVVHFVAAVVVVVVVQLQSPILPDRAAHAQQTSDVWVSTKKRVQGDGARQSIT